jgi:hypothetical protein
MGNTRGVLGVYRCRSLHVNCLSLSSLLLDYLPCTQYYQHHNDRIVTSCKRNSQRNRVTGESPVFTTPITTSSHSIVYSILTREGSDVDTQIQPAYPSSHPPLSGVQEFLHCISPRGIKRKRTRWVVLPSTRRRPTPTVHPPRRHLITLHRR